jgi:hypothetical protein
MRVLVVCDANGECKGVFADTFMGERLQENVAQYYGAFMSAHEIIYSVKQLPPDLSKTLETKYGCPCSVYGCCAQPDLFTPEHECIESVCEGCYVSECKNCGNACACDL